MIRQANLSPNMTCLLLIYAAVVGVGVMALLPPVLALTVLAIGITVMIAAQQRQMIYAFVQSEIIKKLLAIPCTLAALYILFFQQPISLKMLVISGILLIPVLVMRPLMLPVYPAKATVAPRIRWIPVLAGVVMLGLVAEGNGHLFTEWLFTAWFECMLLIGGIGLFAWGMSPHKIDLPRKIDSEWIIVLLITLLALGLRVWKLETAIHHFVDEYHFLDGVTQFWEGNNGDTRLLMPFSHVTAFPRLYPYLQNVIVRGLGSSLFSLRLLSALLGALTVPALYMLARYLFDDRPTAMLSALMLAVLPTHLHFSRLALNNIADPFFGTLALAFLARAGYTQQRRDFVLAGVMLGLTQYFYEGGRLLFPPLVLALAILWRQNTKQVLLMGLVAVVVAFPVYYALLGDDALLTPRLDNQRLTLETWRERLSHDPNHVGLTFQVYTQFPDGSWFYQGNTPLLLAAVTPFFLLGVICAVGYGYKPGGMLLILWLVSTSLGNSLMRDPDWFPRYVVAFPALALLTGLGLRYTANLVTLILSSQRIGFALIGILAAGLMFYQVRYYFGEHVQVFGDIAPQYNDLDDALFRARDLPPEAKIYIIDNQVYFRFNIEAFRRFYHIQQPIWAEIPQVLPQGYFAKLPKDSPYAFFLDSEDWLTRARIERYFTLEPPQASPYDVLPEKQLILYYAIPKESNPVQ